MVGTRANPNVMAESERNEQSDTREQERVELTPSSSSGRAGSGESGARSESKHVDRKRKRSESDEEDWGFEGKSYWKSELPQSVETAEYVHLQIPLPFKKGVWEGNYCDLTLFLPKENEKYLGKSGLLKRGGSQEKSSGRKLKQLCSG